MTHSFYSGIHYLAVCLRLRKYSNFCQLSFDYTVWTIVDARVKKDEHLEIQTILLFGPQVTFLNFHPFSPGGFFTFLVAL